MPRVDCCLCISLCVALAAQAAWATTPPPAGYIDASTYGWNSSNATTALQNAINTGQNVWVPKEASDWYVNPIFITNHANQTIQFESGAAVTAMPGGFTAVD